MLTKLLIPLRVLVNLSWAIATTLIIGAGVVFVGIFKLLLPVKSAQVFFSYLANGLFRLWAYAMSLLFQLAQPMQWHIEGDLQLHPKGWYLILANHRSWVDVFVLMHLARRNMPMPRFFLKHQLLWIPIVGWGCWVLDMPFMRRYSKETLLKKPHLAGRDIETTARSCKKFRYIPTTVVNFCEGTRFTPAKQQLKKSPYRYLLPPKAGGTAFSLQTMGRQFEAILDITIAYPGKTDRPVLWHLLSGQLRNVYVDVRTLPITEDLIGDYNNDDAFKKHFQKWLNLRWHEKDATLERLRAKINASDQLR